MNREDQLQSRLLWICVCTVQLQLYVAEFMWSLANAVIGLYRNVARLGFDS